MNYIQRIYDLLTEAQINEGMQRDIRKMKGIQKALNRASGSNPHGIRIPELYDKKTKELKDKIGAATKRAKLSSVRGDKRVMNSVGGTHAQRKVYNAPKGGIKDTLQNMDKRSDAIQAAKDAIDPKRK